MSLRAVRFYVQNTKEGKMWEKTNFFVHFVSQIYISVISFQQFHEAAYLADDRQDLLSAINSFLDCSIVLPPSEMGGDELLRSVARFQREMLRKREEQEVKLLAKEPKSLKDKGEHPCLRPFQGKSDADALHPTILINDPIFCYPEALLTPLKKSDDPLERTRRPFGGLIQDVRRRYPKYLSDFKDALNSQCMAAVIFIYFAALSPAITFGGLLGKTHKEKKQRVGLRQICSSCVKSTIDVALPDLLMHL